MTRLLLCHLATLHACSWQHAAPSNTPDISMDVIVQRSDAQDGRAYGFPVEYEASFTCGEATHYYNRTKRGAAGTGRLKVYAPSDCERPLTFGAIVRPLNTSRCRSTPVGPAAVANRLFTGQLIVSMQCNSAIRSAKLQAVPILECYESETAIVSTSAYSYRAEGCERSIEL